MDKNDYHYAFYLFRLYCVGICNLFHLLLVDCARIVLWGSAWFPVLRASLFVFLLRWRIFCLHFFFFHCIETKDGNFWQSELILAFRKGLPKATFSIDQDTFFVEGHEYEIRLWMDFPESKVNREIGMFMVGLSLIDSDGRTEVGTASKPVNEKQKKHLKRGFMAPLNNSSNYD